METPELAMLAGYGSQCRGRGHEDGGGSCRAWGDPGRVWGGRAQGVTGGGVTRRRRVWSFAVAARPVVLQSAARGGPLVAASTAWLSTTFCIGQRQGALHAHPTYCPSFHTPAAGVRPIHAPAIGMLPLPARRNSLCLFCAFAARPRAQAARLGPRIQTANRSGGSGGPKRFRTPQVVDDRRPPKTRSYKPLSGQSRWQKHEVDIASTVRDRMGKLEEALTEPEFLKSLTLDRTAFDKQWAAFQELVQAWVERQPPELEKLVEEASRRKTTLDTRLRYLFYAHLYGGRFTTTELGNQKEVADLRYPAEWYPATRQIPRSVHMHVGPTNSGKTYHALKRLEEADTGIYLGPLRLLAHEVYTRLNAQGKACALVTGEEQRMPEGETPGMFSCTVEMAPLNTTFDVAVVDEIQMISHPERGWAWTQAFLGLQAREIHLCGEARTVPLMRELCALVGDEVHVHEYERLTPLKVEPTSLRGNLKKLEKGDCVVAFSVIGIHALRREIEKQTGKHCAMVYGSLPPETRAQQARLFNDPDNDYDYLVASDAIGMGLNLYVGCQLSTVHELIVPGPSSESSSNQP
jgi:ATP-dependent RNA helicase SUPV3L1/SUV3